MSDSTNHPPVTRSRGNGALPSTRSFLRALFHSRLSQVGGLIFLAMLVMAAFAPWIAPHDIYEQAGSKLEPPNSAYWLGTDEFGRDILSRTVYGARISLFVAVFSTLIGLLVGTSLGSLAGFARGRTDEGIMRVFDVMLAFPGTVMAIFLASILGPNLRNATIAIGIVYTPSFARVARGQVLTVSENDYVEAAHALGNPAWRVLLLHVLPNAAAPIIVQATINFANAIVVEAALSFLGLGAQPPEPSWGTMLSTGRKYMELAPWVVVVPGAAISITVLGLNLFGDALRDLLDPQLDFKR